MTNEPSVSEQDREAAIAVLAIMPICVHNPVAGTVCDHCRVSALVSHGWGPKARVSREELTNWVEAVAYPDLIANGVKGLSRYLRECGIEVTDD